MKNSEIVNVGTKIRVITKHGHAYPVGTECIIQLIEFSSERPLYEVVCIKPFGKFNKSIIQYLDRSDFEIVEQGIEYETPE